MDRQPRPQVVCPGCKVVNGRVREDDVRGRVICLSCGVVVENNAVSREAEWRGFTTDDKSPDMCRVGHHNTLLPNQTSLPTTLRPVRGTGLAGAVEKLQDFADEGGEKRIRRLMHEHGPFVVQLATAAGLPPPCVSKARAILEEACTKRIVRAGAVAPLCVAVVFAAGRLGGSPRPLQMVCSLGGTDKAAATKQFNLLRRHLAIPATPPEPAAYVPFLCSSVRAPYFLEADARDLCRAVAARLRTAVRPASVAAAAVRLAAFAHQQALSRTAPAKLAAAACVGPASVRRAADAAVRVLRIGDAPPGVAEALEAHALALDAELVAAAFRTSKPAPVPATGADCGKSSQTGAGKRRRKRSAGAQSCAAAAGPGGGGAAAERAAAASAAASGGEAAAAARKRRRARAGADTSAGASGPSAPKRSVGGGLCGARGEGAGSETGGGDSNKGDRIARGEGAARATPYSTPTSVATNRESVPPPSASAAAV